MKKNEWDDSILTQTDGTWAQADAAWDALGKGIDAALEVYANVHRGSGHKSMVSTHLFEQAREVVLDHLGLKKGKYIVIFCTDRRAEILEKQIRLGYYQRVSSADIGLPLGVSAMAVRKKALPKGIPFDTGGGTTKLISRTWVIWAAAPDRFEAGTPAVINIVTFARTLQLTRRYGKDIFRKPMAEDTVENVSREDDGDELAGLEGINLLNHLKKTGIGNQLAVPTRNGSKAHINLDNSASTPSFWPIRNSFVRALKVSADVQAEIVRNTRRICADFLGAPESTYESCFVSNTSEALNLAAENLGLAPESTFEPVVLTTLLEHSSNDLPYRFVPGTTVERLSVDDEGFLDLPELETQLSAYNKYHQHGKKRIRLVVVSGASNVLGTCNNLEQIARIAHKYDARILVDAAQLVAHRRINMKALDIDFLAFSAHKIYAPFGSGMLLARRDLLNFSSEKFASIQASGESNVAGIAALGTSLSLLQRIGMEIIEAKERELTAYALREMATVPGMKFYGISDPESPSFAFKLGVIPFDLNGIIAFKVSRELAERRGIGVRHGCLCAHILVKHILKVGPKLEKFQWLIQTLFPKISLPGIVRVSLGIENSHEEVDVLVQTLKKITHKKDNCEISAKEIKKKIDRFVEERSEKVFGS